MTALDYLQLGVEQYLRELDDDEFDALSARVRPPKPVTLIRNRNSKHTNTSRRGEV